MNRIEKAAAAKGLSITDDNKLAKDQRKIGNIGRLISAARAAEAAFNEEVADLKDEVSSTVRELAAAQHELSVASQENAALTRELATSQQRVKSLELRTKVEANEFTQAQRRLLLENGSPSVASAS